MSTQPAQAGAGRRPGSVTSAALLEQANRPPGQALASQATHIEQARAIAQVQGALVVAQERPRDEIAAYERMREACKLADLAKRAFFNYRRGGSPITGPSIHLATELARCWGNIDYGIVELRRDEYAGESEMQAYAWDLQTNARHAMSFIVPHRRDTREGGVMLTDTRDVYENNANQGARRLRECIFRLLPAAFREEAEDICAETVRDGGGVPIEQRRAKVVRAFAEEFNVSQKMLERRMGTAAGHLTAHQIAQLEIIYVSLRRGETTVAEQFDSGGDADIAMAELKGKAAPVPAAGVAATAPPRPAAQSQQFELLDAESKPMGTHPSAAAWLGALETACAPLAGPARVELLYANWRVLTEVAKSTSVPAEIRGRAEALRTSAEEAGDAGS